MTAQATGKPSFLAVILKLETNNGYSDRAVIGGLDKFLAKWAAENLPDKSSSPHAARLRSLLFEGSGYAAKSVDLRRQWVQKVLDELDKKDAVGEKRKKEAKTPPVISKPQPVQKVTAGLTLDTPVTAIKGVGENIAWQALQTGSRPGRGPALLLPASLPRFQQQADCLDSRVGKGADHIC